jgi:hypothetical protein
MTWHKEGSAAKWNADKFPLYLLSILPSIIFVSSIKHLSTLLSPHLPPLFFQLSSSLLLTSLLFQARHLTHHTSFPRNSLTQHINTPLTTTRLPALSSISPPPSKNPARQKGTLHTVMSTDSRGWLAGKFRERNKEGTKEGGGGI